VLRDGLMPGPMITFAIPFYTGITYLARVLQSILAQEDPNWEAIVCDDGPEQGVEAIVRTFGGGRVRYLRNPKNLGIAGNFNRCLDVAETDLVTVLHADDELLPTYCGTMRAAALRHPRAAALFCRAEIIDERGEHVFSLTDVVKDVLINPSPKQELILAGEPGIRALLKGNFIMAPTLCFRKDVIGARRFPEGFKFVMDWELTTSLLLDGEHLIGLPERCYRYRRHDEAATSKYTRTQLRFREESGYYDRMKLKAQERGWDECVRLATRKRIIKLNVTYRALKNVALLDLQEARRGFRLLRDL
jgi:glycosyltransferase involved in cell wall biosynthesis